MQVKAFLICAAGATGLYFLSAHARSPVNLEAPPGWSVSDTIGEQYRLGFDKDEGAYFIENTGSIEKNGVSVNEKTVPSAQRRGRVPYSEEGLLAEDPWAAAIAQSFNADAYVNRRLTLTAEVKLEGFDGQMALYIRHGEGHEISNRPDRNSSEWQTISSKSYNGSDKIKGNGIWSIGLVICGTGRVFFRNVKIEAGPFTPPDELFKKINTDNSFFEAFKSPRPNDHFINLGLRP